MMKIRGVEAIPVKGPAEAWPWIFVRVHTDGGPTGLGEATSYPGARAVLGALRDLDEFLTGRDARNIERLWQEMYRFLHYVGSTGAAVTAISGIDIALWDILGQSVGAPIYRLLGGACQNPVPLYTHPRVSDGRDAQAVARAAAEAATLGYRALKFDPFVVDAVLTGHLNRGLLPAEARASLETVRAVREAVGPDAVIALDAHGKFDLTTALRLGRAVAEHDILFLEEPIPPENPEAMALLARQLPVPIATGERLYTRWGFRPVIRLRAAQILTPDVARTGGISEVRKIASAAEEEYLAIAPHNPNGPVATWASAHASAALANLMMLEYVHYGPPWRDEILSTPLPVQDGAFRVPETPGLGVALDVPRLRPYRWDG